MNTASTENVVVELVDDESERGHAEIMTSWSGRTSEILASWSDRTPEID